jgi:hypothetical protein
MRIAHLHFLPVPQAIRLAGSLSRNIPYCESLHGGLAPVALKRRRLAKYVLSKLFERSYLDGAALHHSVSSLHIEGRSRTASERHGCRAQLHRRVGRPSSVDRGMLENRFPELHGRRIFFCMGRLDPSRRGLISLFQASASIEVEIASGSSSLAPTGARLAPTGARDECYSKASPAMRESKSSSQIPRQA